jgi:hypothetical protein
MRKGDGIIQTSSSTVAEDNARSSAAMYLLYPPSVDNAPSYFRRAAALSVSSALCSDIAHDVELADVLLTEL